MNKVFEKYTNIVLPGSFSGLSGYVRNNSKINKDKTLNELCKYETFSLHRSVRHNFSRNKVITPGIDHTWQADLVDVHQIKYQNSHYNYILTCIDTFSKYAWAIPIKTKTAENTKSAFEIIFKDGRLPKNIYVDGGNEFKGVCKKYLETKGVDIYLTKSKYKASVVERFNRTLKEKMWRIFTFNQNKKYIAILPSLISSYNNSYHRSIKTIPSKVNNKNQNRIFYNLYGYNRKSGDDKVIKFKYKTGDYVRISLYKNIFEKGYTPNWSKEIYIIKKILPKQYPLHILVALNGEEINSYFYENELQIVSQQEFPFDSYEILTETNKAILAKQINTDNTEKKIWIKK